MPSAKLTSDLLELLRHARTGFGPLPSRHKLELLQRCSAARLADPRAVRDYHALLLYLAAHPDGPRHLALVGRELQRVAEAAARLASTRRGADVLGDTGIAGTEVVSSYTIDLVTWIDGRFPDDVEVAWEDGSAGQPLDDALGLCAARVEGDGLLETGLTTERWVRMARGPGPGSDLAWLLERLSRLPCPPAVLDRLFDAIDLRVRVRLREPAASLTFARFPSRRTFYQRGPLQRSADPARIIARRLPAARRLSASDVRALIETARMALAVRGRETDPVTQANPQEVALFPLERGVDVAIFGMLPERRLPIESFFGYVAARNRVPVAYGGAWVFFDRAEIGVNVFDAFRGGESALLFCQIMRVYRRHFGARHLLVDPFQFGADNAEGIRSGAFWFYYRLGFRPVDAGLAQLAASEWQRLQAEPGTRSTAGVLRRLAGSKLAWSADGSVDPAPDLVRMSLAVTRMIGERFDGDRDRAERDCRRHVERALGIRDARSWTPDERRWIQRLGPLVALVPDLERWPVRDRRALAAVLRAKGGIRERDYAERLRAHGRLRAALAAIAAGR